MIVRFVTCLLLLCSCLHAQHRPASVGIIGDTADIQTPVKGGVVLMGGSTSVDDAFKWMLERSGGGDVVILRATGTDSYNSYIDELGKSNSIETLKIDSRDLANNDTVANIIRHAEMLFIAGGDQSNYLRYWKGTKTDAAINYLLNVKKAPVGGTSAGCAILSGLYYSGEGGSAVSIETLANPYDPLVTLHNNDFLHPPYLQNVLTDQHFLARGREGRHASFLARIAKDWHLFAKGIAVDEQTAVCIDTKGVATVMGQSKACFIYTTAAPERCVAGQPLEWNLHQKALQVYELPAGGHFDVAHFDKAKAQGGTWNWWYVDNGRLVKSDNMLPKEKYVMVIHGGAGTILKKNMTPEKEAAYRAALKEALTTGYQAIQAGKSSIDAVEATIRVLEDCPLFNAGKGAVFTHDGRNEMDAAIMNGKTLEAGAVAGVTNIKNPISAARAVMEKSEHVMMTGPGAEQFAKDAGIEIVDPKYFWTKERWDGLQQALKEDSMKSKLDHSYQPAGKLGIENHDNKFGTVGAVALDKAGNLAAATSTGGMTNKKYGRIGDSPIIGAGTYANNKTVAVSCTGWGEFYIRNVVAYDLSALIAYKGLSVEEAGKTVIAKVDAMGGDGGLIALDKDGNAALPFNTDGMYRGTVTADGKIEIHIYKED
ncbi:beta-aspartyl-peptidase (threonine type) [Chitinophaga sp. YR573]|uniref:isoaspartyl peptidase/L-asparaginase n=1 Tax=Chitinophaga sp. YR573 TaxID=1881040 RepID=UPI0008B95076|nr:isoaspartyl peptidase/L-asparaginase [Chitinophaga sp. YR573]SEW18971.1 beta-aspartyl-peptidase (threonine type) [Chitinophaga sp. YR573]